MAIIKYESIELRESCKNKSRERNKEKEKGDQNTLIGHFTSKIIFNALSRYRYGSKCIACGLFF